MSVCFSLAMLAVHPHLTHANNTLTHPPCSWVIDKGIKKWSEDIRAYKAHLRKVMMKKQEQRGGK